MAHSTEQDLSNALGALKRSHPRITGVVLASPEGRSVSDPDLPFKNKLMITGMAAASMAILKKGFQDNQLGNLTHAQISGDNGTIVLVPTGARAVLCVVVEGRGGVDVLIPALVQAAGRLDLML